MTQPVHIYSVLQRPMALPLKSSQPWSPPHDDLQPQTGPSQSPPLAPLTPPLYLKDLGPTFFGPFVYPPPLQRLPNFLYHYTDRNGYENILQDHRILASGVLKSSGAVSGLGVYLTSLPPETKNQHLLHNNFGNFDTARYKHLLSKVEYVFQFRSDNLPGLRYVGGPVQRDVFLFPWSWIELDVCAYMVYKRDLKDGEGSLNKVEIVGMAPSVQWCCKSRSYVHVY